MQNPPRDERSLARTLAALEQRIRTLETAPRPITGALSVGTDLTVGGDLSVGDDVTVGGDLFLVGGTTTYRNRLSSAATVANTVTETFLASMTIPANDAVVGAEYRIKAFGTYGVTATPTLNIRVRLGGVGGTSWAQTGALTTQSGVTNRLWIVEQLLMCESVGVSASWTGPLHAKLTGILAGSAPFVNDTAEITTVIDGTASTTVDSTISNVFGITATWGTANAANTITCKGFVAERVA